MKDKGGNIKSVGARRVKQVSALAWNAANLVYIFHHILAARLQIREEGHAVGDGLEVFKRKFNPNRVSDSN